MMSEGSWDQTVLVYASLIHVTWGSPEHPRSGPCRSNVQGRSGDGMETFYFEDHVLYEHFYNSRDPRSHPRTRHVTTLSESPNHSVSSLEVAMK